MNDNVVVENDFRNNRYNCECDEKHIQNEYIDDKKYDDYRWLFVVKQIIIDEYDDNCVRNNNFFWIN